MAGNKENTSILKQLALQSKLVRFPLGKNMVFNPVVSLKYVPFKGN